MNPKIFPIIMMVLNLMAAISYLVKGDIRHTIYWVAACVLTASITF
jgi:hypothetical protein